jgi:arsenate reductase
MSILLYFHKRNFEVQKAERYLKERRIAFQAVNLARHKLGRREVEIFARAAGSARNLLDLDDAKVKSHPAAYTNDMNHVIDYILEEPRLLHSPILRKGNQVAVGFDEATLNRWSQEQ